MLTFIHNEAELKKFFDIVLPPLNDEEVFFVSMSARNKQLTEEERRLYDLGRTEMFERKIIREKEWMPFLRTIRKFEMHEGGMTGRSGMPLPSKCLIIYFNVNPCKENCVVNNRNGVIFYNGVNRKVFHVISWTA